MGRTACLDGVSVLQHIGVLEVVPRQVNDHRLEGPRLQCLLYGIVQERLQLFRLGEFTRRKLIEERL